MGGTGACPEQAATASPHHPIRARLSALLLSKRLTEFSDLKMNVSLAAAAVICPNISCATIEDPKAAHSSRELNTAKTSASLDGLRLKNWFQCDHRKEQSNEREDCFRIQINAHGASPIDVHHNTQPTSLAANFGTKAKCRSGSCCWSEGEFLAYVYDFGDNLRHEIVREKIVPACGAAEAGLR